MLHRMNYQEIINKCLKGNSRAQYELFEFLSQKMMTVCLRYMINIPEAEDVFQMAFIKVFNSLKDFHNDGSFEGWVRRIFVNSCLDQIRKNKKTRFDVNVDDVEYKLEQSDYIFENLVAEDLMKVVMAMPDGYRTVFNLFAIEGYSHKEIASELGITESTSKSQYKRARGYLMNILEKSNHGE
jgi:RNA polymerase sigma factor (sigma-70 family)